MKQLEEFDIVLSEMPKQFSTNEFILNLRELGVSESVINSQIHIDYLLKKCDRISNRLFIKKESIDGYKYDPYSINNFIKERYIQSFNEKTLIGEIFNEYLNYCLENKIMAPTMQSFNKELKKIGVSIKRLSIGMVCQLIKKPNNKLIKLSDTDVNVDKSNSIINLNEEICIKFLKDKGYKILKPTYTEL